MSNSGINTSSFYGNINEECVKHLLNKLPTAPCVIIPYKMSSLVNGPPITWRIFKKQDQALNLISLHKQHLMAFAYESGKTRLFLVAHPEVFWHYDSQRTSSCRCTYEIIPENTACKLYFDIEFLKEHNPEKNGQRMVKNFISIVIYFLKSQLGVNCEREYVLNLDSSTDLKFSCHLIFNIPCVCFANNKEAGHFVKYICNEIMSIANSDSLPAAIDFLNITDFKEMIIRDAKGNFTLFCDQSVYSRNRHFRLYKSTKYGKSVPLIISPDNEYKLSDSPNPEREIFYASLITYFPDNFENFKVLHFDCSPGMESIQKSVRSSTTSIREDSTDQVSTHFSAINTFIEDIVMPGKIFRSCFFPSARIINYDIVGNRFCGNIGRQHKSNNIKYIVDLKNGVYYQKCHDFECAGYKSEKKPIPKVLLPLVDQDNSDNSALGSFDLSNEASQQKKCKLMRFPSCGLSDEDIVNHLNLDNIEGL